MAAKEVVVKKYVVLLSVEEYARNGVANLFMISAQCLIVALPINRP